jgi:hypothetical protein
MKTPKSVLNFLNNGSLIPDQNFYYCQTRDQISARLAKWMTGFEAMGESSNNSAIITAIIGEIANNSFDHNLGQWKDTPGCVVNIEKKNQLLVITIVDRGQGIISSLSHIFDKSLSAKVILAKAFEERISGRAPEKRGNGLKFVLEHLKNTHNSLICCSQQQVYSLGEPLTKINLEEFPTNFGTFICIEWSLK